MSAPAYSGQYPAVASQLLTANGTVAGVATVPSTRGMFTFQLVTLSATGLPTLNLMVKEVTSPTTVVLGLFGNLRLQFATAPDVVDISAYTTALSAAVVAAQQNKIISSPNEVLRSAFMGDPVDGVRMMPVDDQGFLYGTYIPPVANLSMAASVQGPAIDGRNFSMGSISTTIVGTAVGTLGPQVSNDGTNWIAMPGFAPVAVGAPGTFGGSWTGNGWAWIRASWVFTSGTGSNPVSLVLKKA